MCDVRLGHYNMCN